MHSRKKPGEVCTASCCGEQLDRKITHLKDRRKRHPKPRPVDEVVAEVETFIEDVGL